MVSFRLKILNIRPHGFYLFDLLASTFQTCLLKMLPLKISLIFSELMTVSKEQRLPTNMRRPKISADFETGSFLVVSSVKNGGIWGKRSGLVEADTRGSRPTGNCGRRSSKSWWSTWKLKIIKYWNRLKTEIWARTNICFRAFQISADRGSVSSFVCQDRFYLCYSNVTCKVLLNWPQK